jgi:hypothetical protein
MDIEDRCPHCGGQELERLPLKPSILRVFRLLPPLRPRRCLCNNCGRISILWR